MGGMAWRAVTCLICTTTVHFFAGTTTIKINGTDRNPKGWQSDTIGTSGCKLLLLRTAEQRKWLTNAPKILLRQQIKECLKLFSKLTNIKKNCQP
jgi:hypothetical protein